MLKQHLGIGISIGGILLLVSLAFLVTSCSPSTDLCINTPYEEFYSPSAHSKAVVFERSCGATTGFSTQISIVNATQSLEGAGNVYIASGQPAEAALQLHWQSDNQLVIGHSQEHAFLKQTQLAGVNIRYP